MAHLWGRENMTVLPKEAGTRGRCSPRFLPRRHPSARVVPRSAEARASNFATASKGAQAACLAYKVRFPVGFDFVKGGKLPGLFGGDAPRGCVADDKVSGFSSRLMWRTGGAGELYLYAPGRETACGQSIGRGTWTFTPGAWTSIVERVTANTPGSADGSIELWVDGHLVVDAKGLTLAAGHAATVDGVLFATFFGGSDASWATPARPDRPTSPTFALTAAGPDGF